MSRLFYLCGLAAVVVIPGFGLSRGAGTARAKTPMVARYSGQTGGIEWIKTSTTTRPVSLGASRERLATPEVRSGAVRG